MKIEGTPTLRRAQARQVRRSGDGDRGFAGLLGAVDDAAERAPVAGTGAAAPVGSIDALLAMQPEDDATARRRQARARAGEILDRLEDLRRGLLDGVVPRHRLEELVRLTRTRRGAIDDPRLAELLDEIDLRAQVELAKLDAAR